MKFYITGVLAYETAKKRYEEDRRRFASRFPRFFLEEFEKLSEDTVSFDSFLDKLCIEKNTRTLYSRKKFFYDGSFYIREVKAGGLFAALWEACEDLKKVWSEKEARREVGCIVNLFEIPLDQHVVELLEYAGENPYEVCSEGCLLIASEEEPEGMAEIGQITTDKARLIRIGERERYLTPHVRQEKDIENRQNSIKDAAVNSDHPNAVKGKPQGGTA